MKDIVQENSPELKYIGFQCEQTILVSNKTNEKKIYTKEYNFKNVRTLVMREREVVLKASHKKQKRPHTVDQENGIGLLIVTKKVTRHWNDVFKIPRQNKLEHTIL